MRARELQDEATRLDELILGNGAASADVQAQVRAFEHLQVPAEEQPLHERLVQALLETLGWRKEHHHGDEEVTLGKAESTPMSIPYAHRRSATPTPNLGETFNQHVEPAGKYLSHHDPSWPKAPTMGQGSQRSWFEYGTVHFQNPLVHQMAPHENLNAWKLAVSAAHGNRKGRALSNHLRKLGYDGIVVRRSKDDGWDGEISEMVNLGAPEEVTQPFPDDVPIRRVPGHIGKAEDGDDLAKADPYARARQLILEAGRRPLTPEEADHAFEARKSSPVRKYGPPNDKFRQWMVSDEPRTLQDAAEMQDIAQKYLDPKTLAAHKAQQRQAAADQKWESQAMELGDHTHLPKAHLDKLAGGKHVWLYHGTSSKFLPSILRDGLKDGVNKVKVHMTEAPGVRLTARPGSWGEGGTAAKYAEGTAHEHGGNPVVLRVKVPYDHLTPDTDDEDLSVGRHQFIVDLVPPEAILEANGKRLQPASKKGKCKTCGTRWKDPK